MDHLMTSDEDRLRYSDSQRNNEDHFNQVEVTADKQLPEYENECDRPEKPPQPRCQAVEK